MAVSHASQSDAQILHAVQQLVDEEHLLRQQATSGELDLDTEHHRLAAIEGELDQCWDLLRQRRARREFGADADGAQPRPVAEVEEYLQ